MQDLYSRQFAIHTKFLWLTFYHEKFINSFFSAIANIHQNLNQIIIYRNGTSSHSMHLIFLDKYYISHLSYVLAYVLLAVGRGRAGSCPKEDEKINEMRWKERDLTFCRCATMRIRYKVAVAVMKLRQTVPMARHLPGQVDQSPPSPITWKDNTTVGPSAHRKDAAGTITHALKTVSLFREIMTVGFHKNMPFPGLRTRVRQPDRLQKISFGPRKYINI